MSNASVGVPRATMRTDYGAVERKRPEAQQLTAMLKLAAPTLERVEDRKCTLSVSVAVDVSGSMQGERLTLAIETLQFVVGELKATDELGIIAYDTHVTERLPVTRMDDAGKAKASAVAAGLRAGSSTNLSGGLFAAVDQVLGRPLQLDAHNGEEEQQQFQQGAAPMFQVQNMAMQRRRTVPQPQQQTPPPSPEPNQTSTPSEVPECTAVPTAAPDAGKIRAVLLLTDGHANAGLTTADTILPVLQRSHIGESSVAVHTFGYGSDHNADLLRAIAEATQGSYYFIGVADQIKEAFANCLGGLVSVVMQGIRVRCVAAATGVRVVRALTKYPATQRPDGGVEVRMSDLYSGETRDTLVELEVAAGAEHTGATVVARWRVDYDDSVGNVRGRWLDAETVVTYVDEGGRGAADAQVDEQRHRLRVVEAMEEARRCASGGQLDDARAVLGRTVAMLDAAPSSGTTMVRGLVSECRVLEEALTSRREWEAKGSKMANMAVQRHAQQRSNVASEDACAMYSTPHQQQMVAKARKK